MTRSRATKTISQTSNPSIKRQSRRLSSQQKQLEKEILSSIEIDGLPKLLGAKSRTIKLQDIKKLDPLTPTQGAFFDAYNGGAMAFSLSGSAGTGKSFIALYHGLLDILDPDSQYDKIIIVRSVAQSRGMGHLPGTVEEKQAPFEAPYIDICTDLIGRKDAYEKLKDMGKIEFFSTSLLRGSTFNNAIVIFDEAQNCTFQEISTVLTRLGTHSKMIVCGDTKQDDLIHSRTDVSGFRDFINVTNSMREFCNFKFTSSDIVRSKFVKSWIVACEKLGL